MLNNQLIEISPNNKLMEILVDEIDEELKFDILEFINGEVAVEVEDLYGYFQSISFADVLGWLEEYEAKWNPESRIYQIVNDEFRSFATIMEVSINGK